MDIIKVGKKNLCTCRKCESEFRWSDADIQIEHQPNKNMGHYEADIELEGFWNVYIVCPVCPGTKIYISVSRGVKASLIKQQEERNYY